MSSSDEQTEVQSDPLCFFDEPERQHWDVLPEEETPQSDGEEDDQESKSDEFDREILSSELYSDGEEDDQESKSVELDKKILSGKICSEGEPNTSSAVGAAQDVNYRDPLNAYNRADPQLLNELAHLLSQRKWSAEERVPHGIVNILNYPWHGLTEGALHSGSPKLTDKRLKSGSPRLSETPRQVSANVKEETAERSSCGPESVGSSEMEAEVRSSPRVKKPEQKRAHNFATSSFSIFSGSCNAPGWIIQTNTTPYDELQWIRLCQWVVKRLQAARNPEKLQTKKQDLNKPLILRHYTDVKAKLKDRGNKDQPISLVTEMPHIPEVRLQKPVRQKLHYSLNDGSSFIYYPSGCMAVCQSHSGLTCGGFYTNVFSDAECPVVLATITAFGHGAVTHPLSSVITAAWNQDGGLICDHYGNITEEWSWETDRMLRRNIHIQLSDQIFVRLFSAVSAMLSFRCDNESVQLPLSSLSNQLKESCLQSDRKFTSDALEKLQLAKRTTTSPGVLENMQNLTPTPVSVCSQEVPKVFREMEGPEVLSALWRKEVSRELRRLQQRVRTALEDWLDYYRVAIGIKCPDTEQIPEAPLRTRMRRNVQSAALPSLEQPAALPSLEQPAALPSLEQPAALPSLEQPAALPSLEQPAALPSLEQPAALPSLEQLAALPSLKRPASLPSLKQPASLPSLKQPAALPSLKPRKQADAKPVQPKKGRNKVKEPQNQLSSPTEKRRSYKMKGKKDHPVTLIGPLQIYGNIKPESVILLNSPETETSSAVAPLTPSIPLTVCPALLRAILQREGQQKRCCCSATMMPTVTDLEYDAFIMGQPPHSQQIIVVCVTQPCEPVHTQKVRDPVEDLYRKRNKHRTMPCTQCQMDSFRLVRYEMLTVTASCGLHISLLQQRHNAAPGMVLVSKPTAALAKGNVSCTVHVFTAPTGWQQQCLYETEEMYIRGKLLFVGYILSGHSCSARDLQKQISRTRADYRLGLSLVSDYKFSIAVNASAFTNVHRSSVATGDDITSIASEEKETTKAKHHKSNS